MSRIQEDEITEGIALDVSSMPGYEEQTEAEPRIGDIYRSKGGAITYWWIVGFQRTEYQNTAFYLVFSPRGKLVGTGRIGIHALQSRTRLGHADLPAIEATWF